MFKVRKTNKGYRCARCNKLTTVDTIRVLQDTCISYKIDLQMDKLQLVRDNATTQPKVVQCECGLILGEYDEQDVKDALWSVKKRDHAGSI